MLTCLVSLSVPKFIFFIKCAYYVECLCSSVGSRGCEQVFNGSSSSTGDFHLYYSIAFRIHKYLTTNVYTFTNVCMCVCMYTCESMYVCLFFMYVCMYGVGRGT